MNRNVNRAWLLLWLTASTLIVVPSAEALDQVSLQLRWDHQFQFAGYYAAEMMGYYQKAGLDVEIRSAVDQKNKILSATDEVASGRADFGVGGADIILKNETTANLRVLASVFQKSAARFYIKKDKWPVALSTLAESYRVARRVNDLIDVELQAMLRHEGIDPAEVKPYKLVADLSDLINHQVDVVPGYSLTFPFYLASRTLDLTEIDPAHHEVNFYGDTLFTNLKMINRDPEMVGRFVAASLQGWSYALAHSEQVVDYLIERYPRRLNVDRIKEFNLFQAQRLPELMNITVVEPGHVNATKWKQMHLSLKDSGLVNHEFKAEGLLWVPQVEIHKIHQAAMETKVLGAIVLLCWALLAISLISIKLRRQKSIIKQSEHEYRALFVDAAHGSLIAAVDTGEILSCNQKLAEMTGRRADQLIGQHQTSLHSNPKVFAELTQNPADHSKPIHDRVQVDQLIRPEGKIVAVEIHASTIVVNGRQILHSSFYDISERKQHELLQEAQLRLINYAQGHSVQELMQQFLDEAESLTKSEVGFYHCIQEDQESLSLQTWSTNTRKNMCAAHLETTHYPISKAGVWVDSVREKRATIHNDYASLPHRKGLPEGHAPIVRELVVPVFREGKIVAILGVGNKSSDYNEQDVSILQRLADFSWETVIRKQAQEQLLRSQNALEKSQGIGHIGTWELDLLQDSLLWTAEIYRIFELPLGSHVNYEKFLEMVHPEDRDAVARQWQAALKGQPYDLEHRILISGETKWVREKADLTFNEQGVAISAIGVTQDITNYKKLMDEQKRSAQLAALGTVAAGVAHEINNPVQGIIAFASLIKMRPEKHESVIHSAEQIIMEGQRIASITKDLLYYSKENVVGMTATDIQEVVEGALALLKTKLIRQNVVVEARFAENLPLATVQPQGVQQIVVNLVDNAFDAVRVKELPAEDKVITVSVDALDDKGLPSICVEVRDKGVGMSEAVQKRAKEAFFSTKPASQGAGLGMSIVNDIVNKHNGRFDIESVEGEYTRIRVWLPVTPGDVKGESPPQA